MYSKVIQLYIFLFSFRSFSHLVYYRISEFLPCALTVISLLSIYFKNSGVYIGESLMAQLVKNLPAMQETQETWFRSLGQEDPLEKEMAIHSNIIDRKFP